MDTSIPVEKYMRLKQYQVKYKNIMHCSTIAHNLTYSTSITSLEWEKFAEKIA